MFKRLNISQGITLAIMFLVTLVLLIVSVILVFNFRTTTLENVKYSSREINKQVIMNYENYIDEVIQTANYISIRTTNLTEDNDLISLEAIYLQAKELSEDIVSIVLLDSYGNDVVNSNNQTVSPNISNLTWFNKAINNPEIFNFSAPHTQDIFIDSTQEVITISKLISFYNNSGDLVDGVLTIDLNTENIIALADKTNLGEHGHIVIISDNDEYIYSNNQACDLGVCESKDLAEELIFGGKTVVIDEINMYLNVNTLTHTRWRIATYINIEEIYTTQRTIILTSILIFLFALISSYLIARALSKRISNPMQKLSEHMNKLESDYLLEAIKLDGQKEVVQLSESFNNLIYEIRSLMDRLVTEQKEKRKSEFFALQMQINPHFLYNTLDSIVWLAENQRNQEVVEMVIALSKFFRISISKGENIIPVKFELEHAKNYLNIQKIRYNRQFDFEFEIEDEINDYKIVKLILQPLIENAINHGISSEESGGFIKIKAYIEDEKLCFEIINNGYGLSDDQIMIMEERMKDAGKAQSVGLRNVYQRLKIYYGDLADIIITSKMDEYTSVKIVAPARKDC